MKIAFSFIRKFLSITLAFPFRDEGEVSEANVGAELSGEDDYGRDEEYRGEEDDLGPPQLSFPSFAWSEMMGEFEDYEEDAEDDGGEEYEGEGEEEGEAEEEDQGSEDSDEPIFTEEELRFLVTELPMRKWASTFCVERILSILMDMGPEGPELGQRLLLLWKFYTRRSANGVLLPDIKLLMDILVVLESRFRKEGFAVDLQERILNHYRRGVRIRKMSDKGYMRILTDLFTAIGKT